MAVVRSRICVHLRVSAVAVLATLGCIARTLTVESVPPGAELRLNGEELGPTPVTVSFRHYGTYAVELRKDGFETLSVEEPVMPPWYARFPLGIVSELLWPGVIQDYRWLEYELKPPVVPERAGLIERAARAAEADPAPP